MKPVDVREAMIQLSALLTQVQNGDEIITAGDGAPVARLAGVPAARDRLPGMLRGVPVSREFVYDAALFAPMSDAKTAEEGRP